MRLGIFQGEDKELRKLLLPHTRKGGKGKIRVSG